MLTVSERVDDISAHRFSRRRGICCREQRGIQRYRSSYVYLISFPTEPQRAVCWSDTNTKSVAMTQHDVLSFKPCSLVNQNGLCYSNSVLQCLSRLTNVDDLRSRLGLVEHSLFDTWCPGVDVTSQSEVDRRIREGLEKIHPAVQFLCVMREMQNRRTDVVYPYHYQAALSARGGKRGEEFASGIGAYPYCWFRFVLDSLCEGTNFNGHPEVASNDVIDEMYKVGNSFSSACTGCCRIKLESDEKAVDWGLRLHPEKQVLPELGRPPTSIQQLLDTRSRLVEDTKEHCTWCMEITKQFRTWKGLRLAPEILCIEIKTYELEKINDEVKYKFLFSNVAVDETIIIPIGHNDDFQEYALQSFVKLEGRGHEHAVAYVQSSGNIWWKCSDDDITQSTYEAAQSFQEDEQVSLLFYRKLRARM
jgi:hypothetical protein